MNTIQTLFCVLVGLTFYHLSVSRGQAITGAYYEKVSVSENDWTEVRTVKTRTVIEVSVIVRVLCNTSS